MVEERDTKEIIGIMIEQDILNVIEQDKWMMDILRTAESLQLKDWLIGAGFVRNKVWNHISGYTNNLHRGSDVDLVYFDPDGNDEKADDELSEKLKKETGIEWEVVNEFYAHIWNGILPYTSTQDAIAH